MTHVRLVGQVTLSDGTVKDTIIRHIHGGAPYGQRPVGSNIPAHTRYITGSSHVSDDGKDLVMPWPADDIGTVYKHSEPDTTRLNVEDVTWSPGLLNEPLGYHFEVGANVRLATEATAAYTLGLVENRQEADNQQRAGLSGFVHQTKLDERRTRIARSILDELRPKAKRETPFHDNTEWVKRKMLEDARAIWFRDRKVLSPLAEAAERAVQEKRRQKQEQINREMGASMPHLQELADASGERTVSRQTRLSTETLDLIKSMQAASLTTKYKKPDNKFAKRLARIVV